jgi:hypothetical protein
MDFSIGTYPQASINNPTSAVRRGIVENGPQYYVPMEMTAKISPINFNGEVGHWFGNQIVPSRSGRHPAELGSKLDRLSRRPVPARPQRAGNTRPDSMNTAYRADEPIQPIDRINRIGAKWIQAYARYTTHPPYSCPGSRSGRAG